MKKGVLDVEELLRDLNPSQREAVTTLFGPLLILAGAGSGKTRVITHRIAYLMASGERPERILALTFTNKAAQEMKERVMHLLGQGWSGSPFLSTFHAFGLWVLRRFAHHLGYSLDFNIYDDSDQLVVVKQIVKELEIEENRYTPRSLLGAMSRARVAQQDPEEIRGEGPWAETMNRVYKRYGEFLRLNNAMDFDDLILLPLRLLEEEESVREFLQERFHYVMVDEYQDTNTPQYQIVRIMAEKHGNLCVVGDDDQSIYSWRGADVRNIFLLERDFPEAKVLKLEENYRSTQTILGAAWHVIRENTLRKEKRLFTANPKGEKITLYLAQDEKDEARYVVSKIKGMSRERPLSHFAVFYRTNAQSRPLEETLNREGIPYRVVGGLRFYDRKEIKDMIAYLRLVENPNDILAFRRVVNTPKRGIGDKTIERVLTFCQRGSFPLWEGLKAGLEADTIPSRPRARFLSFVTLMEELREASQDTPLSYFLDHLMGRTGYIQSLEEEDTIEAHGRIENLRELVNVAVEYDDLDNGLREFIDRASLTTSQDERGEGDRMTLMTLHSAKGLEFPVVFMVGMEEGFLPHTLSLESLAGLEEERRLCYVGFTRAKNLLFLSYAQDRLYYGRHRVFAPSRFLRSIPQELLMRESSLREREAVAPRPGPGEAPEEEGWKPGDRVTHPVFGPGMVKALEGTGSTLKVRVRFDKVGEKLLVARLARLRKGG